MILAIGLELTVLLVSRIFFEFVSPPPPPPSPRLKITCHHIVNHYVKIIIINSVFKSKDMLLLLIQTHHLNLRGHQKAYID